MRGLMLERQYWGGVLAGTGLGMMIAQWLIARELSLLWPFAFAAVGIGAWLAHTAQKSKGPAAPNS